jgi:hypothetical protein
MMNWKECGRKLSWPNLRYYLGINLERLMNTKNFRIAGLQPEI